MRKKREGHVEEFVFIPKGRRKPLKGLHFPGLHLKQDHSGSCLEDWIRVRLTTVKVIQVRFSGALKMEKTGIK